MPFRTAALILPLLWAAAAVPSYSSADSGHPHEHAHAHAFDFGQPAPAEQANRRIEVLLDEMTFQPQRIQIESGDTVLFVVKNQGQLLHEFNLGSAQMHAEHQTEMAKMLQTGQLTPTGIDHEAMHADNAMSHDDPNSVLVEPGDTAQLAWHFTQPGTIEFACNVPGHYALGMVGKIDVVSHPH